MQRVELPKWSNPAVEKKKRKRCSSAPCSGEISTETALEAMRHCPFLDASMCETVLIERFIPPLLLEMAKSVYNNELARMSSKLLPDCIETDHDRYEELYVPAMNKSADELLKQDFNSVEEAQLVLCQMIRSYVPVMSAHLRITNDRGTGSRTVFTCSTVNHTKSERDKACKCEWKAILVSEDNETYKFETIDTFDLHKAECLKDFARFTSVEVTFQQAFPPITRRKIATILKQVPVNEWTYTMRRNRWSRRLKSIGDQQLRRKVDEQGIDDSVTNLPLDEINSNCVPEETHELLQY